MELNNEKDLSSIISLDHRCSCGKLLFKGFIASSKLEIKCRYCKAVNIIGQDHDNPSNNVRYSILFALDGKIIDASLSITKILGYTKEELVLMKIQEIDPLLKISTYAHLAKIPKYLESETFTWDTLHQNKKGKFILVRTHLRYVKNTSGINALGIFEILQEASTVVNDKNIDEIAGGHCDFLSRVNTEGTYTHVSTKLATLLGHSSIEMLGKPMIDFHQSETREKIKDMVSKNTRSKGSFRLSPHTMLSKNQDIVKLESYFAPDINDRGQLRGFQIMSWLVS